MVTELPPQELVTAFTRLLRGTHLAPPDRLPTIISSASQALGARAALYLVDYELDLLVPFADAGATGGANPLGLDGTLAGRVFRLMQTHGSTADGRWRLWVPVVDGVEPLGVLDLTFDEATDLDDPGLRARCAIFAHLIGHLVTIADGFGDAIDRVRRSSRRSVAAELIWQLIPPQTAGTDKVIVSGRLEPSNRVGGDVFDYALSEGRAHLALLDATGHDLAAGLVSAAALSAYRNARRAGRSLFDQARAVDDVVTALYPEGSYATGVLAELDLDTGRLRYIVAGHPSPLLLRRGHVVKALTGGGRALFGFEARHVDVGEETLEYGDTVVLYSDGITEARDAAGAPFGPDGLADFLERQAATGAPPPEVLRRLTKSILERCDGDLRDDATVLLAHWTRDAHSMLDHNAMVLG